MKRIAVVSHLIVVLSIGVFYLFWEFVMGGSLHIVGGRSVTVSGTSKTQVSNQIASFSAGVAAVNDSQEAAVTEVNNKMSELVAAVKEFGIEDRDIQTSNISIFQEEEPTTIDGRQRTRPGQWRVSNTLTITLRDIVRASELTALLTAKGSTNVFGPNFRVDDSKDVEVQLLHEALADATQKADALAKASGRRRGRVLTIVEDSVQSVSPLYARDAMGSGGGAPIEPGSQTISKSVSVTFELR